MRQIAPNRVDVLSQCDLELNRTGQWRLTFG
jgi:hypothetical protein